MTQTIEIHTGTTGYPALLSHVLQHGYSRTARGRKTIEAGRTTVVIHDPSSTLPLGLGRKLSSGIAAAEAIQLIGGFSEPRLLPDSFSAYREDDGSFHGAYGVRIGDQVMAQIDKITNDIRTRQAVITLWDPRLDNAPARDIPCTVALVFSLDESLRLNMDTIMRSQDCWLGAPYDWFQFTQLQWTVARVLRADVGWYAHTTLSTHLYESDVTAARDLVEVWAASSATDSDDITPQPRGIGETGQSFTKIRDRARQLCDHILDPDNFDLPFQPTSDEEWYVANLRRYR